MKRVREQRKKILKNNLKKSRFLDDSIMNSKAHQLYKILYKAINVFKNFDK